MKLTVAVRKLHSYSKPEGEVKSLLATEPFNIHLKLHKCVLLD